MKLHNEELNLYVSPNIVWVIKSRRMKWAGYVLRMAESKGAYRALVARSDGRRPLRIPRRRWENKVKNESSRSGMGHGLD